MFRLILVQFTEARPIGHYDGSVNRLCPELSTASVDERYVPSQVQREHMAVSALDDLPFDNASAGRCSVGSVVIPFHPGVTASQRHISPGFFGRMTLAVCSFSILHACSAIIGVTPLDLLSCG
jgi:hypothetical protein